MLLLESKFMPLSGSEEFPLSFFIFHTSNCVDHAVKPGALNLLAGIIYIVYSIIRIYFINSPLFIHLIHCAQMFFTQC
jgi:hypothetical protein